MESSVRERETVGPGKADAASAQAPLTHEIVGLTVPASGSQKTWARRAKSGFLPKLMVKDLTPRLDLVFTWVRIQPWPLKLRCILYWVIYLTAEPVSSFTKWESCLFRRNSGEPSEAV